jgi:hypothetical protein
MREYSGGGGQRAYLRGPGEAGGKGWWRRLVLCGGGGGTHKLRWGAQRRRGVSSWARSEGAGGASCQRLAKCEGVQGWSMWVSRPPGHALLSTSLLRGKRFLGVSIGRSFLFACAGPTEEHCPLFLGLCVVIFLVPRHRETHVFFFLRIVLSGFAAPFLSPFARRVFGRTVRADCFSFRRVRSIWRGGAGARGVVAGLK